MSQAYLHIIFWICLGLFSLISCILAVSATGKAIRLRNVRLQWKAGRLKGYPLFSTLFLAFSFAVLTVSLYQHSFINLLAASLYVILSAGWFITSFLASKRYITDHGIVKNVNEPSQTVAWHQIQDFVEKKEGNGCIFIFMYVDHLAAPQPRVRRIELNVPQKYVSDFQKLISYKLGRRISCCTGESLQAGEFK